MNDPTERGGPYRTAAKPGQVEDRWPGAACTECQRFIDHEAHVHRFTLASEPPREVLFHREGLCIACFTTFRNAVETAAVQACSNLMSKPFIAPIRGTPGSDWERDR